MKINPTAQVEAFETKRATHAEAVNAPASTALVSIGRVQERPSSQRHVTVRPSASFVTQLIATAEQAPQTRTLRRATLTDALAAYGHVTAPAAVTVSNNEDQSRVA